MAFLVTWSISWVFFVFSDPTLSSYHVLDKENNVNMECSGVT